MTNLAHILQGKPGDEEGLRYIGTIIRGLVGSLGTVFLYQHSEQRSDTVTEHYWQEQAENGVRVVVVDDIEMPARYVYVSGSDPKRCRIVWKHLGLLAPIVQVDELRVQARDAEKDPGALPRLALALNAEFDPESFEIFIQCFRSRELEVRIAAAMAVVILKWRRFVPHVEAALARESDEEVRRVLEHVLEVCKSSRGVEV
jgi:hypothetical protein